MSSQGGFPQEKEVDAAKLGGQTREAMWILIFSLEQGKPVAYSTNRPNNVSCFTLNACVILCTTCRVLFNDGDRLHGSTLPYNILVLMYYFCD
jgi:hypothetical protein